METLRVRKKNRPDGAETKTPAQAAAILRRFLDAVSSDTWEESALESTAKGLLGGDEGWKPPELFMLIRKAVTGTTQSPPVFETLAILGPDIGRSRLEDAASGLEGLAPAAEA